MKIPYLDDGMIKILEIAEMEFPQHYGRMRYAYFMMLVYYIGLERWVPRIFRSSMN